jgi:hypothetical protein
MRGGKSLLILLVIALGLGGYIYFVESKKDAGGPAAAKKDKVVTADADKIEELEVRAASGDTTRIKKSGTDWQITAPAGVDADGATIGSMLSSITSLESERVVDEKPASVKEFGLDPVRFSVGFRLTGETAMHRVEFGTKTPNGSNLYARVEGQPKLFLVGAYLEDSLNKSTFDLRDKSVLKFAREGADALKLEAGDKAIAVAKKGADWRMSAPVDARADFTAIDGIISSLAQARMKAFVAADAPAADLKKYGLDKPQAVVTVGAASNRASLAIGAKTPDGTLYARDLARPMIFTVENTLLDTVKKKPDDLRLKDLFQFRSFSATSLDITQGGQTASFVKQKGADNTETWKQTKPAAKDVDQTRFMDLLNALSNLRAEKFADSLQAGDEVVVVAHFGEAAAPTEEKVTFRVSKTKPEVVHAGRGGEAGAAVVTPADFDKALALIKELVK